jgi:hypothetical protein
LHPAALTWINENTPPLPKKSASGLFTVTPRNDTVFLARNHPLRRRGDRKRKHKALMQIKENLDGKS